MPWRGDDESWADYNRRLRVRFYTSSAECKRVTDHLSAELS